MKASENYLMLGKHDKERPTPSQTGLSVMTQKGPSLSAVDWNQWIKIGITADTGACDSVIPKDGPWSGIEIVSSAMSWNQEEYEVANAA